MICENIKNLAMIYKKRGEIYSCYHLLYFTSGVAILINHKDTPFVIFFDHILNPIDKTKKL